MMPVLSMISESTTSHLAQSVMRPYKREGDDLRGVLLSWTRDLSDPFKNDDEDNISAAS